jgi:hypothetical protein
MRAESLAYLEVGRSRFHEYAETLRLRCYNAEVLEGDQRVNHGVLMLARAHEKYGPKLEQHARWTVEHWFPDEWKSILWLQLRLEDYVPNPHAPYEGERAPQLLAPSEGAMIVGWTDIGAFISEIEGKPARSTKTTSKRVKAAEIRIRGGGAHDCLVARDDLLRVFGKKPSGA